MRAREVSAQRTGGTTVLDSEMAERHALSTRYRLSQEITKLEDQVRGCRIGINALIREEKRLQAEIANLKAQKKGAL